MKNASVILLGLIALSGCSIGSGTKSNPTSKPPITNDSKQSGENTPKLDRGDTLVGPDKNANGVRDDIDAYIAAHFSTAPRKMAAAIQFAKGMQAAIVVDLTKINAAKGVASQLTRATNCIYTQFAGDKAMPPVRVSQELETMTTNTKARQAAYRAYNEALDGTSWSLPDGDTCD